MEYKSSLLTFVDPFLDSSPYLFTHHGDSTGCRSFVFRLLYFGKFDFSNSSILVGQAKNEAREESEDVFRFEEDYWSKHDRNFPFDRSVRLDARARAVSTGPPA